MEILSLDDCASIDDESSSDDQHDQFTRQVLFDKSSMEKFSFVFFFQRSIFF